jgi:hypothetical protein
MIHSSSLLSADGVETHKFVIPTIRQNYSSLGHGAVVQTQLVCCTDGSVLQLHKLQTQQDSSPLTLVTKTPK